MSISSKIENIALQRYAFSKPKSLSYLHNQNNASLHPLFKHTPAVSVSYTHLTLPTIYSV